LNSPVSRGRGGEEHRACWSARGSEVVTEVTQKREIILRGWVNGQMAKCKTQKWIEHKIIKRKNDK
jgi:hypothetical protein